MKLENTTLKGRQAAICVLLCLAGLLVITVLAPRKAVGQEAPFAVKGTAASPTAANVPSDVELTSMSPVAVLPSASYATGGKGMRNQGAGAIVISGAKPPIKAALIYWAAITQGPPTAADQSVIVQRLFPTPASASRSTWLGRR